MVNINNKLELIKEKSQLTEETMELSRQLSSEGISLKERHDLEIKYHKAKIRISDIVAGKHEVSTNIVTAEALMKDVNSRDSIPRYETGIEILDEALRGGFEVGTLVILAGESFAGKTHLVLEILTNIAQAKEVLFFNFEMGDVRVSNRLSNLLHTDSSKRNMLIDNATRDIDQLCRVVETYAERGVKFFAIDSKMKLEVSGKADDHKKYAEITGKLSKLTQRLEVIILLINQMNEEDIKTGRLAFKGGGDQMYDADIALFYKRETNDSECKRRILECRKNRQDEVNFKLVTWLSGNKTVGERFAKVSGEGGIAKIRTNKPPVQEIIYQMPTIGA